MDRLSGLNCLFGRQRQTISASIGSASPPFKRRAHFVSAIFFINFGAYGTSLRFHEENGMNPNKIWRWLKKNRFRSQLDERWNAENQRRTTQNNNRVRAHTSTIDYLSGCKKHVIIRLFNRHFTKVWCKIVSSTPYNYPTCNAELFWLGRGRGTKYYTVFRGTAMKGDGIKVPGNLGNSIPLPTGDQTSLQLTFYSFGCVFVLFCSLKHRYKED